MISFLSPKKIWKWQFFSIPVAISSPAEKRKKQGDGKRGPHGILRMGRLYINKDEKSKENPGGSEERWMTKP
jgi:hypothetical protein